jgi:hypothetical protein
LSWAFGPQGSAPKLLSGDCQLAKFPTLRLRWLLGGLWPPHAGCRDARNNPVFNDPWYYPFRVLMVVDFDQKWETADNLRF